MAESTLSLVDRQEYEELKSFIEAKLDLYLSGLPFNGDISRKVREAMENFEAICW